VRRWRDAEFTIRVENPDGVMKGVKKILLNGEEVSCIPAQEPGSKAEVTVILG